MPVAGVVPYTRVDIDEEDSLTERFSRTAGRKLLDLAVIRLPRISNFTDFSPFERYANVSLRYISSVGELGTPDMILLPGTKSTIADLSWLRQSGLEAAICKEAARGTPVFGVCGGYQMLGRSVSDPDGVEAAGLTQIRGLGLLDMDTVFHGEKVQRQTAGTFSGVQGLLSGLNGLGYEGYEIHMGQSASAMPPLAGSGSVYGSYIHGVFDAPAAGSTRRPSAASMRRPTRSGSTICWRTPSVRASIWTTSTASCTGRHKISGAPARVRRLLLLF